jgi:tRNA(Arg) A34 adenosine deaminase TadA
LSRPYFTLSLPAWLEELGSQENRLFPTIEERMKYVIELSRLNVRHETGGPFAAAIFCSDDGSLLAPGVNLVLSARCSVLHAEVVTLIAAQQKTATYDLSSEELAPYELVTSTEPCGMCMGAVAWSGIRKLICGARGADAEEAGFDEGEKPTAWAEALAQRGIQVTRDICREQAASVLRDYRAGGGVIYNPSRSRAKA